MIAINEYQHIARKITGVLFISQSFGSAAVIATATISPIAATMLSGNAAWAGVPAAVFQVGAALSALAWGYAMERFGRRWGLSVGLTAGVLGGGVSGAAVLWHSFALYLAGLALLGLAQAAMLLARFAAAEVHPPGERARALSNVVLGGAVGAIAGPLLVGPSGQWARAFGLEELSGPFAAVMILMVMAALAVFLFLRPDPREIGRQIAKLYSSPAQDLSRVRSLQEVLIHPAVIVAIVTMVTSQMVMVMLMVITALHMNENQHGLSQVSLVISSHTFGMFAFSMISGRLADRWGRERVMMIGAGTLILACMAASISPQVLPLAIALFLLGLGWNFCFVGGSSLLADQLAPAERTRTQGFNDLLIGLTSASSSLASGFVFAASSYNAIAFLGAFLSLFLFGLIITWQVRKLKWVIAK